MNKIVVICGPTAVGKTRVAVHLAKVFDAELVSADSRQVYADMDIVTGKELTGRQIIEKLRLEVQFKGKAYSLAPYRFHDVPMWLYDIVSPDEEFSVSHYHHLASVVISNIQEVPKLPIVVGGTGLYIKSLLEPMETIDVAQNTRLRKRLEQKSIIDLQQMLERKDPSAWQDLNNSDRHNPRRLIRRLELIGRTVPKPERKNVYDAFILGLEAPMSYLDERIEVRVDERVKSGAFEEIAKMQKRYAASLPSMSGIGYKGGEIEQWKADERAYARRQMTWFKKQKDIRWFDSRDPQLAAKVEEAVRAWYTSTNE